MRNGWRNTEKENYFERESINIAADYISAILSDYAIKHQEEVRCKYMFLFYLRIFQTATTILLCLIVVPINYFNSKQE